MVVSQPPIARNTTIVIECQNLLSVTRLKIDDSLSHMDFLLSVNKDFVLTRRKDTRDGTERWGDMAVHIFCKDFTILDPPFRRSHDLPQLLEPPFQSSFTPTR